MMHPDVLFTQYPAVFMLMSYIRKYILKVVHLPNLSLFERFHQTHSTCKRVDGVRFLAEAWRDLGVALRVTRSPEGDERRDMRRPGHSFPTAPHET